VNFTATDSEGCSQSFEFEIEECEEDVVTCNDILLEVREECDETTGLLLVEFDFDNGTAPYTLSGDFNFTIANSGDDWIQEYNGGESFSFSVVDANGCEGSYSGTFGDCEVNACPGFQADFDENCNSNNGFATLNITISGGTAPYDFTGDVEGSSDNGGISITSAGDQSISFTVTDAEGCVDTFSYSIDECNQDGCDAVAGQIVLPNGGSFCHDENVIMTADGYNDDADFAQVYLMLEGTTIVAFTLTDDFGVLSPGTYCVHPLNVDGGVEFGLGDDIMDILAQDENCFDIDLDCTEITVLTPPSFGLGYNYESCENSLATFIVLSTSFSGGAGGPYTITDASANISDQVLGTYAADDIASAEIVPNAEFYIEMEDANGCRASVVGMTGDCLFTAIELLEFDGRAQEQGNFLYWSTASENNSDSFVLEYSKNGEQFTEIARLEAAGQSNTVLSYDFLHADAPEGVSYYRLVEFDQDGTSTMSNVVSLYRDRGTVSITGIAPVPTSDVINVSYTGSLEGEVQVRVYSVSGQLMLSQTQLLDPISQRMSMDVSQLPAGSYFISLTGDTVSAEARFVKN
ncbi:T9SS type A sorting domain-containing protein, partial [Chitinophagales bacterium]|nr:T9SS type A sorting domain-containing protein [Chitinophagales bacterium]